MALAKGDKGPEVVQLQLQLKALGYECGDIDGKFGPKTDAALRKFQDDYDSLTVNGRFDAETSAALAQALVIKGVEAPDEDPPALGPGKCSHDVWAAFESLVDTVTTNDAVRYGPGRGLFRDGEWIVTYGPGGLGKRDWRSASGGTYPSFHCSSWTNFFLGWLMRYDEEYTHAGNVPSLFDLCEKSRELHPQKNVSPYRGYGPYCQEIKANGQTLSRRTLPKDLEKALDLRELYDRRTELPTFLVCGQSTRGKDGKWLRWHHTVLYVVNHKQPGTPMHRIAADGYKSSAGVYSAKPMRRQTIDEAAVGNYESALYRCYGVVSEDGNFGSTRPFARVRLEN